jgi:hypothetical protein
MTARAAIAPKTGYKATKEAITVRTFAARAYGHTDPADATWGEMDPVIYWLRDNRSKDDTSSRTVWHLDPATQKEVVAFLRERAKVAASKATASEADAS